MTNFKTEIEEIDNSKRLNLSGGGFAIVDAEDFPYLSRFRLIHSNKEVFATLHAGRMKYVSVPLWSMIMRAKSGLVVSFKNHNPLDFRKENLYWVRNPEKVHRTAKRKTQAGRPVTSKYKGVGRKAGHRIKKWGATIHKDGKTYSLGYFKTQKKAAQAYNIKAVELYGDYAYQNKIKP